MTGRPWLRALGPLAAYAALIYVLSAQERFAVELPDVPYADKWIHAVEYGVFGFLSGRAVALLSSRGVRFAFTMAIVIGACYGASDELHQRFVPGRSSDPWDLLADVIGSILGAGAYAILAVARGRRRREANPAETPTP